MLRGVHAAAKNQWLQQISNNIDYLLSHPYPMEILNELKIIADGIHCIGEKSVEEMWIYILEEQARAIRGF